jgi:hypothetical protein
MTDHYEFVTSGRRLTALRFTTPRQPVVHYAGLGALALLAQVPQDAARGNADVAAITRTAGSPEDLATLDAYCATGSLRRAADLLHLHHSSVARRLEQIGKLWASNSPSPPDCYGPASPSPHGGYSTTEQIRLAIPDNQSPTDGRRSGASLGSSAAPAQVSCLRPWPAQSQIGGPQRFSMNGGIRYALSRRRGRAP